MRTGAVVLLVVLILGSPCVADEEEPGRFTRDWCGARSRLEARGIDVWAHYVTGFWANLAGGITTGAAHEGFALWGFDADLQKLAHWYDMRFHMSWFSYHGGSPSENLIGQFPTDYVSGWESAGRFRFYEIFVEQDLGRLQWKAGQMGADRDFYVSRFSDGLLNAAFGNFALGRAEQVGPFFPLAAPGAFVSYGPWRGWTARAGLYAKDPGVDEASNLGFQWTLERGGVWLTEVGIDCCPLGLPGRYAVSLFGTTSEDTNPTTGEVGEVPLAMYATCDQSLWRSPACDRELGAFLRVQSSLTRKTATVNMHIDTGLKFAGPLPGRSRDVLSFGVGMNLFNDRYRSILRARDGVDLSPLEAAFELTYRVQVTDWLALQPSLQFIYDPHFSRRDAFVFGFVGHLDL